MSVTLLRRRAERWCGRLVLRRTLRRHVGGLEALRGEPTREHDLRVILESVRDHAGVERGQLLTVPLDLEAVVERIALPADRTRYHVAVHLEVLVLPGRRLGHDFIHVLVVLHALAERRVHED